MHVRKRLDIGWLDLASGLVSSALVRDGRSDATAIEQRFGGDALVCLSVRSALDLYLDAVRLPIGSEALVSALTVPDMALILEAHGLVVVPVDVDPRTLVPSRDDYLAAASPRTRLVLLAHLFGTRNDLDDLAALAREREWLVLDDHAQSFTGDAFVGDPRADATFFSFGPIKTATALGGAVARVPAVDVLARMREHQATWAMQRRRVFARRVIRYGLLETLALRPCYSAFCWLVAARGNDLDRAIHGAARSFPGEQLLAAIRRQPSPALLALLRRRLGSDVEARVAARVQAADRLRERLGAQVETPGAAAGMHSHWVVPVLTPDPEGLIRALRARGFDATRVATLDVIATPEGRRSPTRAVALLDRLVYVPAYPELGERRLAELAEALLAEAGSPRTPAAGRP